jgi:hypothetical protein
VHRFGIWVSAALAILVGLTPPASGAELKPTGVVTALEGTVTVTRASAPSAQLRFRDDIFVRDRISAGDRSVARILFGGRAVVTVAERSIVTITETPGVSTLELTSGKIALAVVKERMKPGDRIDIQTPNGIAGIRGTVIVAEVTRVRTDVGETPAAFTSRFTVLHGLVEVSPVDPRSQQPTGHSVWIGTLQSVALDAARAPTPQRVTPEAAQRLVEPFKVAPRDALPAVKPVTIDVLYRAAAADTQAMFGKISNRDTSPTDAKTNTNSKEPDRSTGQDQAAAGDTANSAMSDKAAPAQLTGTVKIDLTNGDLAKAGAAAKVDTVNGIGQSLGTLLKPDTKILTPDTKSVGVDPKGSVPQVGVNASTINAPGPQVLGVVIPNLTNGKIIKVGK